MWIDSYQPDNIKPGTVKQEGDYEVMILGVKSGTISESGKRFLQIMCKIRAEGEPRISLFLTEGPNFNATATAFFDTFNLPRGDQNCESWRGKRGFIHINLAKKDGYTNMIPRYILDENGFVKKSNNLQPAAPMQQTQQVDYETVSMDELGDIPF